MKYLMKYLKRMYLCTLITYSKLMLSKNAKIITYETKN